MDNEQKNIIQTENLFGDGQNFCESSDPLPDVCRRTRSGGKRGRQPAPRLPHASPQGGEPVTPLSQVTNEDCMALMKRYSDKFFDLAVVDPPYGLGDFEQGVGKLKKFKKWEIKWNNKVPDNEYFEELRRVSKHQIIWGANYYNCFDTGGAIVWIKKVTHPDMSKAEIASTNLFKKVEIVEFEWNGFLKGEREETIHPCQKPIYIYEWIFKNFTERGQIILDTHLGSGSSRIAAWEMKLSFIGCELDKEYYEKQEARFKKFEAQGKLF